ncbi:MAG: lysine-2,3-aminomutase-like protein [Hyphomicrobiaceae bacterium]|nr:lysine-2,3-aminomutase-like protein [Hyphomicrobiaceae bacterium]
MTARQSRVSSPANTTLRTIEALTSAGLIDASAASTLAPVAARYAIAITPAMSELIDPSNPHDPIALQFVPDPRELDHLANEAADPIGDIKHEKLPGLIHRYPDRVLLKLTHACPVYCRFCFRREVVGPGGEQALTSDKLDAIVAYIAARPEIFEVILTGGDPLILAPRRIAEITARLAAIPHVQVLRWHSRVPVVAPERITPELIAALRIQGKAVYIGVHTNHAKELTADARSALARLADSGIPLVSQTVLLKGINDTAETLAELFRTLLSLRVKPYYLHHADLAPGTSHFRTTIAEGQALMRQLRGRLSGLAHPTYIIDIPGGFSKVPIGPSYIDTDGNLLDPDGHAHAYPERG